MSRSALLYTALGAGAILLTGLALTTGGSQTSEGAPVTAPASAQTVPKLAFHSTAQPVPDVAYATPDGEGHLSDHQGKITVVNFWATWCAPCRKEMPSLDALATEAGEDLAVLTIGTSRTTQQQAAAFLSEIGAQHLPLYTDTSGELARAMGILGLPVTVILNREGQEIARLTGEEDWNSAPVKAVLAELVAQ